MGTNLKKSFKRTFLFSSVVVIALAVFAFAGFAADKTVVSSGSCGETIYDDDGNISGYSDNATWTLYDDGELVISGSGEMGDFECKNILPKVPYASYSYDSSGDPSDKTISSVVIENGITKIGTYAFCGLSSLTEMEIPDGVETISDYSFEYCKNLKSITFSNAVKKIGSYAFRSCESLTNVEIPSNVTSIGSYAFLFCKSLTRVEIPASMLSIGNRAFESCSMLTEINVDSNNTKYESENGVLFNKGKTTIITYPTGKTDTEYLIPDSVTKIGAYAFYKCINLEKMNIPNSVSVIDSCAFEMCSNLNNITLANSVNEIRSFAFSGCNSLTSITIPYSVTNIDYWAFRKCINLKEINVDSQSKTFESENGALFSKGKTTILKYPEGKTDEEYVIPDSVTKIGYCAFEYCRYLKDLTISENVTTMSSWTFSYCNLLTNVTIKGSMANIREDSFCACKNLTTITIPNTVTDIKYNAFESCNSLKDVYYTGTQEQWQSISIEIGNECLQNATIHTISEPETNKTIDFKNQNGIMTVYGSGEIPSCDENALHSWDQSKDDVTTLIIDGISSIGSNSFCDFPSLVNVIIISDSITIEQNAFVNCPKLENVIVFGDSNFESTAFASCAEQMRVFENSGSSHSFSQSNENINVIPFSYDGSVLSFSSDVQLDSYEFFDTLAAFCLEYDNIEKVKFENLTFEDIEMYYIPDGGASLKTFENNTLKNGEIYPSITGSKTDTITFNELINGMADSSITHFYLIASDESQSNVQNTQVKVSDSIREIIARAIRWIVTLLNKLFSIISRLK